MAKKIVNLDALIPDDETVVLYKGQEHPLNVATTETYLKVLRQRQKIARINKDDELAMTEQAIDLLVLVLPSLPRNDLMRMPIVALMALVDEVMGTLDLPGTVLPDDSEEGALKEGDVEVIEGELISAS